MARTNTTYTDSKGFAPDVVDKKRYETLTQEGKDLFDKLRNGVLEMFGEDIYKQKQPEVKGITLPNFHEMLLRSAENYAFIVTPCIIDYINSKLDAFKKELMDQILEEVKKMIPSPGA